jgi:16S rRNA (adenine1518-N6/adenine1519-N6)-dimethyltransferase
MPRAALGQHFLINRRILSKILTAADLSESDIVLEIGPGKGFLTKPLLTRVKKVVAIEIDEALAGSLDHRLDYPRNLTILNEDARHIDLGAILGMDLPYKVVANLPYYAANPIMRRLLETPPKPDSIIIMVQQEVADSITAQPNDMSLLSVATQVYGSARKICTVPAKAFRPIPKVRSAVVRIDLHAESLLKDGEAPHFFKVVKGGFFAPRKQIRNSLSLGLRLNPILSGKLLNKVDIDPSRRPSTLNINEWLNLSKEYTDTSNVEG